ncbi:VOC family protein [Nigerium massiliense]|uniref:VOC family protein n=1 Tax=Nigerium massiliense TaxID=1522317 RepID=UPI00059071E1|nr:VOC family protein [Nigerium massiliense]
MVSQAWRPLGGATTAWFDAPSLVKAAALAVHALAVAPDAAVDVRATGTRVRLSSQAQAEAVSGHARELGLTADPAALQLLDVAIDSVAPAATSAFWERALGYEATGGELTDPLRRDPRLLVGRVESASTLRDRFHLDVVRPGDAVRRAGLGEASGPYGVRHVDPDGNEVDVVPGDPLEGAGDWRVVFATMACYRTTEPERQRHLVTEAAMIADRAGFPLLIDVRPGLVILDSGKDRADADAHGLDVDFPASAADL